MNNAELIVKLLTDAGVHYAFGIPSGPVLPLIEAMRESPIEYVITAHETSAGFMASTLADLTGVPGVCISTVGPGATNLATGVGAAWLDRRPLLAITCTVPTQWLERRIQMRIDHQALFAPLTKASLALRAGNVAQTIADALAIATAEPPGPVHLDLPEDVLLAEATATSATPSTVTHALPSLPAETLAAVEAALAGARRPLLVTGLSFTRASEAAREALLDFATRRNLPFVTTTHAKGYLPESDPRWGGVIGRARRSDVQKLVESADLILAVGYDPIEINYEEWVGGRPVVHLSSELADSGPDLRLAVNAAGDLDRVIAALATLPAQATEWTLEELAAHRRTLEANLRPVSEGLAPYAVLDVLRAALPADGILAYDVGAHTHQIATQWRTDMPQTCLVTNGWSSMGYGMPAAFAAKLAHPERPVVCVVGDGGFQMSAGELAVARRLSLAVPVVILNDGWYALMKVKQEHRGYAYAGAFLGERVEPPAHYFGVPCRAVHDEAELAAALDWGLAANGPTVIEAFVDVESYSRTVFD